MLTYQIRVDFGPEYGDERGLALYKGKNAQDALVAYLTDKLNAAEPLPVEILHSNGTAVGRHAGRTYRAVVLEGMGRYV